MLCKELNVQLNSKNKIGQGFFSKAYLVDSETVIVVTEDPSKECLAVFCKDNNGYLPHLESLDNIGDKQAFKMPLYHPLKASNKVAWKQYKEVKKSVESLDFWDKREYVCFDNYKKAILENDKILPEIKHDLVLLIDNMSNYSSGIFMELSPRNVKVDKQGKLIFLDIIGDSDKLKKAWEKRLRN